MARTEGDDPWEVEQATATAVRGRRLTAAADDAAVVRLSIKSGFRRCTPQQQQKQQQP